MQPITAAALDSILTFLAPLFLPETGGDTRLAREAAHETLQSYAVTTDREVRLAALAIAFSLRALDALGRAAAADLDVKAVLRLNGSANALNRAALQCQKALDRLRAGDPPAQPDALNSALDTMPALPDSAQMPDLLAFVRSAMGAGSAFARAAGTTPGAITGLSRQQRRAAERQAEKAMRRKQEAELRSGRDAAPAHPFASALPA
ncbi:MAG TPA: hypothetical protein VHO91_06370 [Rhodopila sp.]|nr:hypothetical protein [Rhodopila sp.]